MKALILKGPNEPFIFEDVPDPIPQNGEAVAKVLACGSGLTIQHVKAGRTKVDFPIIIGHEITAEIVELRSNVRIERIYLLDEPLNKIAFEKLSATEKRYYLNQHNCHVPISQSVSLALILAFLNYTPFVSVLRQLHYLKLS